MKMVTIRMEDFLYDFYEKVGRQANLPPEQVMADALFKLAGELSLHALHDAKFPCRGRCGHRPLQTGTRTLKPPLKSPILRKFSTLPLTA